MVVQAWGVKSNLGMNTVGVTKLVSSVPLSSQFSTIVSTWVNYWISHSYLTGFTASQLQWHPSNMKVIQGTWHIFFLRNQGFLNGEVNNYGDVIMGTIASQIISLTVVYSTVYSGADQRKHQSSAPLAFVWGIHRRPVNSPHKWPVTRKMLRLMVKASLVKLP